MKKLNTILLILLSTLVLTACSYVDIKSYQMNEPKLVLHEFFNGDLTAHGIIKNRSGEVIRHFNVTMTGTWDENGVGTLAEKFIFNDNSIEYRTWIFTPTTDSKLQQRYSAKANDTLVPSLIDISGNAFFMNYDLLINYQGNDIDVNIDDKMYLVNDHTIINESVMSKYGFEVGYITLTIIKN